MSSWDTVELLLFRSSCKKKPNNSELESQIEKDQTCKWAQKLQNVKQTSNAPSTRFVHSCFASICVNTCELTHKVLIEVTRFTEQCTETQDKDWWLFYIRVLQIPVCVLLLVQPPQRNQLCLMEFLIVCPEYESRAAAETTGDPTIHTARQVTGGDRGRCCICLRVKRHFVSLWKHRKMFF